MAEFGVVAQATLSSSDSPRSKDPPGADVGDARVRDGAARVRALVAAHFDFVWRLLRRLGVPESDVDDAAQQVFVVAARRIDAIAPDSERTFLFGTALRTAGTLRRNLRRRRKWIETAPADCASPDAGPHEVVEHRQAVALLDELLSELDDDLRVVFVLCELEELTATEVAALQNIPVGTVASRLRRARHEFTKRLRRRAQAQATRKQT